MTMTILPAHRTPRAELVDATTATVVTDTKLRIYRLTIDWEAKVVMVFLRPGYTDADRKFRDGDDTKRRQVRFDATDAHIDPRQDNLWQVFNQAVKAAGGEISLAMIEQIIFDAGLIPEVNP